MSDATTSATGSLAALPSGVATNLTEIFSASFSTTLTAPLSALRPTNAAVAATLAAYGTGSFSIAIYDAGTDADPQNFEALEVIAGGATLSWTVVTEAGWTASAHAAGSTIRATVLTPRSIQQPLNNHITPAAIPDPHSIYIRKGVVTAKGNLIVGTGNGTVTNLPTGADGTTPVADSSQVSGIRWAASAVAGVLTNMGDLIVGGVLGVSTRLGIGSAGQVLTTVQQAAAIADPVSGPICTAVGSGGALVNGISYDFAYAWQNGTSPDGGITLPSPITTFVATTTGIVAVECPAAPALDLTLIVYASLSLGTLMQQGVLSTPSTVSSNSISVSTIAVDAVGSSTNTTGGVSTQWQASSATSSVSTSIVLSATASMRIGAAQTTLTNPMTAVGDLITGGAGGAATRLAPGTAGTFLQSGGAGSALSWGAASGGGSGGGGSGAVTPIQVIGPLTVSQATLPFSVPITGYRNVQIVVTGRTTAAAATETLINLQFNGDTGSSYEGQSMEASGVTQTDTDTTVTTSLPIGRLPGANSAANVASSIRIDVPNFSSTLFKTVAARNAHSLTTGAAQRRVGLFEGTWLSTAQVSTVLLVPASGSFDVGTYACLYGEMDTAGPLLTPASNLLGESILSATAASITIPVIPGGYRDLLVSYLLRCDTAATAVVTNIGFNGDVTAGHYTNPANTTGARISAPAGSTATAGKFTPGQILLTDYSNSSSAVKTALGMATVQINLATEINIVYWTATTPAAITSLTLTPASGNFVAGSQLRVYGLPAAAGGASVGTGTRLRMSGNQSIPTGIATALNWGTEDNDADNQHYTSTANLTGTVAKAAGLTLTGTSTLFTTELSVGQVIAVPGTTTEKRVVTAIASDTSLTVNTAFVNTASGQIAVRINSAVTFRQPGFYTLEANVYSAALPPSLPPIPTTVFASAVLTARTAVRTVWTNNGSPQITAGSAIAEATLIASATMNPVGGGFGTGPILAYSLNALTTTTSGTVIGQRDPVAVNYSAGYDLVVQRQFQQWDFVEVLWTQNAGGVIHVLADERTHWSISARPTVIVAVPYISIQDQKVVTTNGGTFTSGADRTRDLNTVDSDTAGLATLATNQFTIPAGTWRYSIFAPAGSVDAHQAFLYNFTDAVEVKRGTSAFAANTAPGAVSSSFIKGKMQTSSPKTFEVRHRCQTTSATIGFGAAASFGTETYTVVELWKLG